MTCRHCTHSVAMDDATRPGLVLWCALHGREAVRVCDAFCYEPGTGDE